MKMNKYFMLGLAGLAFAACSNEEDAIVNNGVIEGNGVVEVSIVSPATKAIQNATTGSGNVVVGGTITVELYNSQDELIDEATITRNNPDVDNEDEYTVRFYNITDPHKVIAYCNDGKAVNDDEDIAINDPRLQSEPESIPAYGETETITESGEMENVDDSSDETIYRRYVASVELKIPVARIELAGLKHEAHTGGDACRFNTLTINGVYLDKIYPNKNSQSTANYFWGENTVLGTTVGAPILWSYATSTDDGTGVDFKTATNLPGDGQAYAFNFFANGTNPELKIYLGTVTAADPSDEIKSPRYAIASTYKENGEPVTFEAGKIYRITNVTLADEDFGPNEEGEKEYGLELTVVEAQWSVTDITADWVQQ